MDKNNEKLNKIRHSCAHLMAMAVKNIYSDVKVAIGPVIDNGFYYDFDFLSSKPNEEDLAKIEAEMNKLLKKGFKFEQTWVSTKDARSIFKNEPYKLELINEIENGERDDFGKKGEVSIYKSDEFVDLCKGPHVNYVTEIKAFKLLSIAGAYWKGNEKNKMLTRIYGTAFKNKTELANCLEKLEEAKKRDHKKLGKELDLYFMDEEIGKGLPMWTPKGTALKLELEKFTREIELKYGYEHVSTPYLGNQKLYKTSGHLDHYTANMYAPIDMDGEIFYLRPMACPHHIKMYQHKPRSYKDLPIRYAEIADYNRFEKSGELMGLIRVRKFQLTDAHIFVSEEGLKEEFKNVVSLIKEAMTDLGLINAVTYRFSKRDPKDTHKYYPDDALWLKAETTMKQVLDDMKINYTEAEGEAAFYGPKLDIQMTNVNGKEDTAFTAQMDFLLPEKFDLKYTTISGVKKRPVMIHRSVIGALERVVAYIIEHYAGAFPLWLSPVQISILNVSDKSLDYAKELHNELRLKFRCEIDNSDETIGNKIRKAQEQKIPFMLIIGEKEANSKTISVRDRNGKQSNRIKLNDFTNLLAKLIQSKSLDLTLH